MVFRHRATHVSCCDLIDVIFSGGRRHTRCALVTGIQTCALPIFLIEELHAQGCNIIALHRANSDVTPLARFARLERVFGDVSDQRTLRGIIPREVDCVFHVAGNTSLWNRTHVEQLKVNVRGTRSEEHTSELQSLMRISYAVFCLKKNNETPKRPY